jgi:hypothetical protein
LDFGRRRTMAPTMSTTNTTVPVIRAIRLVGRLARSFRSSRRFDACLADWEPVFLATYLPSSRYSGGRSKSGVGQPGAPPFLLMDLSVARF